MKLKYEALILLNKLEKWYYTSNAEFYILIGFITLLFVTGVSLIGRFV